MKKCIHVLALLFGSAATLTGLWLIGLYFSEAVFKRLGEPDQSLVFWYIPILCIGIVSIVTGVVSFLWGLGKLPGTNKKTG